MTAHRVDLGSVRDPLLAGNPLRLDATASTNSGQAPGSYAAVDLAGAQALAYALFSMVGDLPASTPSFVLSLANGGITVTSESVGGFSIEVGTLTGLWTGRDWHSCRMVDGHDNPFDLFDGYVVSTRALDY